MSEPIRILIVEDLPTDAELAMYEIRKSLSDCVFQRVETESAYLEALETYSPDLILSDYHLPRFTGMQALKLATDRTPMTPLIIFTGSINEDIAVECMKAGATNYIIKENIRRLGPAIIHALEEKNIKIERKRAEENLRESEERYRTTLNEMMEGCQIIDYDWRYLYVNKAGSKQGRKKPDELLMRTMMDVYPGSENTELFSVLKHCMEERRPERMENKFVYHDGSFGWFELSIQPVPEGLFILSIDITERKKAEADLRESEDRYRDLVEHSQDLICTHDLQGNILSANQAATRFTGYPQESLPSMNMIDLLTPQVRQFFPAYLKKIQTSGWARGVMQIQTASGEIRYWEYDNTLRSDGASSPVVRGIAHDITERKRAEKELKQSEEKFRALIENSADYISLLAADGSLLWESPADISMLGYAENEFVGNNILEIVHPDDLSWVQERFAKLASTPGGQERASFRLRRQDGSYRWVEATVTNLLDKASVQAIVINYHDITERKQAEEKLHLQSAALEAAANTIVITNRDGIIQWVNPAFTALTGFDPSEAEGKNPGELLKSGKQDQAFYKVLWNTILSGKVWRGELINRRKDGSLYPEEMTITPLQNQHGQISHFIAVKQDISGRKQAEQKIIEHLQHLRALHTVDTAIASNFDLRITIGTLLEQLTSQLKIDAASISLFEKYMLTLEHLTSIGFYSPPVRGATSKIVESLAEHAIIERHILHIPDLRDIGINPVNADRYRSERFVSYYAVPLIAKGQIKGVMEIFQRTPLHVTPEWLEFLETMTEQAAIAIDISRLFGDLQKSNLDLTLAYDATIAGWSQAMDLRDRETEGHTLRVTETTEQLARLMNVSETEIAHMRRGALLHDIGKLGVPDHILLKPDKLSDDEWVIMRQHPASAYEMLRSINYLQPALHIPHCHHEKWDGTGYPQGLKGEQIPLAARIFAVVDVWDAVTSDRPYRSAWSKEQALNYIREQSGRHFDPEVVNVFLSMMSNQ